MDNHDLRQLIKMRQQIDSYRNGGIDLNDLIADLVFLRDALTTVDQEWEPKFNDCLVNLESVCSYRLEKNSGRHDVLAQKIIDDTISTLIELLFLAESENTAP